MELSLVISALDGSLPPGEHPLSDAAIGAAFDQLDANGDGVIDLGEFLRAYHRYHRHSGNAAGSSGTTAPPPGGSSREKRVTETGTTRQGGGGSVSPLGLLESPPLPPLPPSPPPAQGRRSWGQVSPMPLLHGVTGEQAGSISEHLSTLEARLQAALNHLETTDSPPAAAAPGSPLPPVPATGGRSSCIGEERDETQKEATAAKLATALFTAVGHATLPSRQELYARLHGTPYEALGEWIGERFARYEGPRGGVGLKGIQAAGRDYLEDFLERKAVGGKRAASPKWR